MWEVNGEKLQLCLIYTFILYQCLIVTTTTKNFFGLTASGCLLDKIGKLNPNINTQNPHTRKY